MTVLESRYMGFQNPQVSSFGLRWAATLRSLIGLAMLLVAGSACSADDPVANTKPVPVTNNETLGTSYMGAGTVTLSSRTVANECSGPVEATLVIAGGGVGHLTLSYRTPMSDKVVVGEELRFVCVEDGEPTVLEYRTEGVDGTYLFEPEFLVSGTLEAVVGADKASVSGQVLGASNVWDFVIEDLSPAG
jgi:hypothetical protein